MFGYKERLNLESYIIFLLLDNNLREDHKLKFQDWIKQTEPKNAAELSTMAHNTIAHMARTLAEGGSLLGAHAIIWNYRKEA